MLANRFEFIEKFCPVRDGCLKLISKQLAVSEEFGLIPRGRLDMLTARGRGIHNLISLRDPDKRSTNEHHGVQRRVVWCRVVRSYIFSTRESTRCLFDVSYAYTITVCRRKWEGEREHMRPHGLSPCSEWVSELLILSFGNSRNMPTNTLRNANRN